MPTSRSSFLRQALQSMAGVNGEVALCMVGIWLPATLLLGSDAWLMQSVWALWCAACGAALASRLRKAGLARESAPEIAAERGIVHAIPLATCVCALPGGEILFANDAMVDLSARRGRGCLAVSLADSVRRRRMRCVWRRCFGAVTDSTTSNCLRAAQTAACAGYPYAGAPTVSTDAWRYSSSVTTSPATSRLSVR